MRKRNLKKTILAAALAVPVAFSYPGWAVRAQEDEKVSTETEAQEVMQDNTAPEEAECEENPAHDEMDGAETDSTETDSTEADRNVSEEEKFFQSGLIANEKVNAPASASTSEAGAFRGGYKLISLIFCNASSLKGVQ